MSDSKLLRCGWPPFSCLRIRHPRVLSARTNSECDGRKGVRPPGQPGLFVGNLGLGSHSERHGFLDPGAQANNESLDQRRVGWTLCGQCRPAIDRRDLGVLLFLERCRDNPSGTNCLVRMEVARVPTRAFELTQPPQLGARIT